MKIEQYSFGELSIIWMKRVEVSSYQLKRLIGLWGSRFVLVAVTALGSRSKLVDVVNQNPMTYQFIAPEQESITSEALIFAQAEDILVLSDILSSCDARCITLYGLDEALSIEECKAFRCPHPEEFVVSGQVQYCTSIVNDEYLVSIMLNRSKVDTDFITAELKTLFK